MFIFKVKTETDGWIVYGDVAQYHFERIHMKPDQEHNSDRFIFKDYKEVCSDGTIPFNLIYLKKDWGSEPERTLLFNTVGYICNEKGDTIEKIQ